jgi:hypothetical protein
MMAADMSDGGSSQHHTTPMIPTKQRLFVRSKRGNFNWWHDKVSKLTEKAAACQSQKISFVLKW